MESIINNTQLKLINIKIQIMVLENMAQHIKHVQIMLPLLLIWINGKIMKFDSIKTYS